MDRYGNRLLVLLIDFDGVAARFAHFQNRIPSRLVDRIFILGSWSEPERLKKSLGPYEEIGSKLAQECRDGTETVWNHELLRHNAQELGRLREHVRPILFSVSN